MFFNYHTQEYQQVIRAEDSERSELSKFIVVSTLIFLFCFYLFAIVVLALNYFIDPFVTDTDDDFDSYYCKTSFQPLTFELIKFCLQVSISPKKMIKINKTYDHLFSICTFPTLSEYM